MEVSGQLRPMAASAPRKTILLHVELEATCGTQLVCSSFVEENCKGVPAFMKEYGARRVCLHAFLTSVVDRSEMLVSCLGNLTLGKVPLVHTH